MPGPGNPFAQSGRKPVRLLKFSRACRWVLIAALVLNVAGAILDGYAGHTTLVALPVTLTCLLAMSLVLNARAISSLKRQIRPPAADYAHIARMEREIYGEAFGHAGAPGTAQRDTRFTG